MKLLELRKLKKLNQTEVAEIIKVSQRTYAGYELAQNEPTIETLIKLADFYGVSLDYLCGHETKNTLSLGAINDFQKETISKILALNDRNFFNVYGYVNAVYEKQIGEK